MSLHDLSCEPGPLCYHLNSNTFRYFLSLYLSLWKELMKLCWVIIIHNRSKVLVMVRWHYLMSILQNCCWEHDLNEVKCTILGELHLFSGLIVQSPVSIKTHKTKIPEYVQHYERKWLWIDYQSKHSNCLQLALLMMCLSYHFNKWLIAFQANNSRHSILKNKNIA